MAFIFFHFLFTFFSRLIKKLHQLSLRHSGVAIILFLFSIPLYFAYASVRVCVNSFVFLHMKSTFFFSFCFYFQIHVLLVCIVYVEPTIGLQLTLKKKYVPTSRTEKKERREIKKTFTFYYCRLQYCMYVRRRMMWMWNKCWRQSSVIGSHKCTRSNWHLFKSHNADHLVLVFKLYRIPHSKNKNG